MKFIWYFIYQVFIVSCLCSSLWATNYYVSSTTGNDSWNGLAPQYVGGTTGPWQTVGKVDVYSANYKPGDYIEFKGGDVWYNSCLVIDFSGTAGNPITVTSYGTGTQPIFDKGKPTTNWSEPDINGVYSVHDSCTSFLQDDVALKKASSSKCSDGNWYYDSVINNLYYKPTSGTPANHSEGLVNGDSIILSNNASYVTISGIEFIGGGLYEGSNSASLTNLTINNCYFNNCNDGIWIDMHGQAASSYNNVTISNNTFDYCCTNVYLINQSAPYYGYSNAYIGHNVIKHSNLMESGDKWGNGDADGLSLQNLTNAVIEYNDISGSCGSSAGIQHWINAAFTSNNVIIRDNYIHDIDNAGILISGGSSGASNTQIYDNIITNYDKNPSALAYNGGGIRLNGIQNPTNPSLVANNVIYNGGIGILLYDQANNYIIKNNIVDKVTDSYVKITSINSNKIDNNCYYPGGTGSNFRIGSTYYTYSAWKTLTGWDSHSITSNPNFVNASGSFSLVTDFQLKASSPCINKGTNVGFTKDYLGNPIQSISDMGAFEYIPISKKIRW